MNNNQGTLTAHGQHPTRRLDIVIAARFSNDRQRCETVSRAQVSRRTASNRAPRLLVPITSHATGETASIDATEAIASLSCRAFHDGPLLLTRSELRPVSTRAARPDADMSTRGAHPVRSGELHGSRVACLQFSTRNRMADQLEIQPFGDWVFGQRTRNGPLVQSAVRPANDLRRDQSLPKRRQYGFAFANCGEVIVEKLVQPVGVSGFEGDARRRKSEALRQIWTITKFCDQLFRPGDAISIDQAVDIL